VNSSLGCALQVEVYIPLVRVVLNSVCDIILA
jgi:hypothetical protein